MTTALLPIRQTEITVGQAVDTISGRFVHEFLEVKKNFTDWIKAQIRRGKFTEGKHFCKVEGLPPVGGKPAVDVGGRPTVDYMLTISCAEKIGMMSETSKGDEIREQFQAYRDELVLLKARPVDMAALLNDPGHLRTLLLGFTEKVQKLESTVTEQKPKVDAFEKIASCGIGELCVTEAAKALKLNPSKLQDWMLANDWTYRGKRRKVAKQRRIDQGFLAVSTYIRSDAGSEDRAHYSILVTPKGLAELAIQLAKKDPPQLDFN